MIDVTDGFIIDLYRVLKMSKKGALLYRDDIPLCNKSNLYRGEDYELIFTVDKTEPKLAILKKKFSLVGRIRSSRSGYKWQAGNKLSKVKVKGYTHF